MILDRLFAALYDPCISRAEQEVFQAWRRELLEPLSGDVLELGSGTGANLALYPQAVTRLVAAEPDRHMRAKLRAKFDEDARLTVADHAAEALPYPDASFDAVVFTLVLCTVADPALALSESRRVLRPGGVLVFMEHVAADRHAHPWTARTQHAINPVWSLFGQGCQLTRDTAQAIRDAGFTIERLDDELAPGTPSVVARVIRGVARVPQS